MKAASSRFLKTYTVVIAAAVLFAFAAGDLSANQVAQAIAEEDAGFFLCALCIVALGLGAICCIAELVALPASPAGQFARLACAQECARWIID